MFDKEIIDKSYLGKNRKVILAMLKKQIDRLDLQRLQQLERLEKIRQFQKLEIQNKSYDEVVIDTPVDETIIYLDPPYENTKQYQKTIDYQKLKDYINNSKYKIYVSSYEFDLPCVASFKHKSTLSATNKNKEVIERLYCNKEHNKRTLFF